MKKRFPTKLVMIILASILMLIVVLPSSIKSTWPDAPVISWVKQQAVTLGLDLRGGTELRYRIDLTKVIEDNNDDDPENDRSINDVVLGVRDVLARRADAYGVAEPILFIENVGDEKQIVAQLAGVDDVEQAKAQIGKTIQLEFKELKDQSIFEQEDDPEITSEEGAEIEQGEADEGEASEQNESDEPAEEPQEPADSDQQDEEEAPAEDESEVDSEDESENEIVEAAETEEEAQEVQEEVVDEEVLALRERAEALLVEAQQNDVDFVEFGDRNRTFDNKIEFREAEEGFASSISSNLASTLDQLEPGQVHRQLIEGENEFTISPDGQLSQRELLKIVQLQSKETRENTEETAAQVETSHILIAYSGAENTDESVTRTQAEAQTEANRLLQALQADPERFAELAQEFSDHATAEAGGELGFIGEGYPPVELSEAAFALEPGNLSQEIIESPQGYHVVRVSEKKEAESRTFDEDYYVYNTLVFDMTPDPWKVTGLDGSFFKYASVGADQAGFPVVNITFNKEGALLFEELTERLTGQPMAIFVGGDQISAPIINEKIVGGVATISGGFDIFEAHQLANDLNTGAISAPVIPVGENTISASLGDDALAVSLLAGIIGLIALGVFMILYYRLMGIFAVLALGIYTIIIVFILNVAPLVMTLAGVAGIILSIGMAVDANILIFERTKEELNQGRNFSNAVNVGFSRAWDSIRDSNVSSLITCAILYFFGTSVIKGFALTLAIGILVSMFTAITVTKAFLKVIDGTKMSQSNVLLGTKKLKEKK